jgi:DNA-binding GntR family transcriptional regulator
MPAEDFRSGTSHLKPTIESSAMVMTTRADARPSSDRADSIVRSIEEDIALGRLRPRERLVEEELALRFAAKRHVVRQAIADLESLGVVVCQRNKGAAVRDFSAEEVEHIYSIRELLEAKAAELIPLPAPAGLVSKLKAIYRRHSAAAKSGDLRTVFRENLLFHKTFFAACGNPHLVEAIEQFAFKAHAIRSIAIAYPSLLGQMREEHAQMIRAVDAQDRRQLIKLVAAHIRPAKEAYLEMHRRISATS